MITFVHPSHSSGRTPLDRYKTTAEPPPGLDPYRFALQRLGLSKEALEERVASEVDDMLREGAALRRLAKLSTANTPRPLSKEDCLTLLCATCVPPPGPLHGVYQWAANLGTARYNFGMDLTTENINLLDAYD